MVCCSCGVQVVAKVYNLDPHPHHEIFLALLSVLFALHLYWCAACQLCCMQQHPCWAPC